uniref:Vps53 N-terminal domain-containing protein n=1 Tax=Timema bartmani TaxID=61472 RepID=A0A7R9F7G0_9NEOP|nr:unnamed protein product [Timema bartmani]
MFPPDWAVSERITVEFCNITRMELSKLMAKRKSDIDVKLLLFVIQRTSNFENLLSRRFTGITLEDVDGSALKSKINQVSQSLNPFDDSVVDGNNPFKEDLEEESNSLSPAPTMQITPFHGIVSKCFEPYLNIYIESLDKNLNDLIERFVQDSKQQHSPSNSNIAQPEGNRFLAYVSNASAGGPKANKNMKAGPFEWGGGGRKVGGRVQRVAVVNQAGGRKEDSVSYCGEPGRRQKGGFVNRVGSRKEGSASYRGEPGRRQEGEFDGLLR